MVLDDGSSSAVIITIMKEIQDGEEIRSLMTTVREPSDWFGEYSFAGHLIRGPRKNSFSIPAFGQGCVIMADCDRWIPQLVYSGVGSSAISEAHELFFVEGTCEDICYPLNGTGQGWLPYTHESTRRRIERLSAHAETHDLD